MNTKDEKTAAQNMVTQECGGETFTYNPETQVLVRDPKDRNRCILIVKVPPIDITG